MSQFDPAYPGSDPVVVAPAAFPEFGPETPFGRPSHGAATPAFSPLNEVELEVTVELGRRRLPLADILRLATGSVVELDRIVGEPLSIYANGYLIAEGEAVVLGEKFGVRVTRLIASDARS